MARIGGILGRHGLLAGQVLLTPHDFGVRTQYLHARDTLRRLLDLGVVPVVNENDTVADDEIRYGDNDRLAALVSHLVQADVLVLLTDTPGLFTADPRLDEDASLIEEIVEVDAALEAVGRRYRQRARERRHDEQAGGGQDRGVVRRARGDRGRRCPQRDRRRDRGSRRSAPRSARSPIVSRVASCGSRSRCGAAGRIVVDDGARRALCADNRSLLPAGVREVEGAFDVDDAVEIVGVDGMPFAKGLVRYSAASLRSVAGRKTTELGDGLAPRGGPPRRPRRAALTRSPRRRPADRHAREARSTTAACGRACATCTSAGLLLRAAMPSVTLPRTRRRPTGGESSGEGFDGRRGAGEGETGSPPAAAPSGRAAVWAARSHHSRRSRRPAACRNGAK